MNYSTVATGFFSDESTVEQFHTGKYYVRKPPGKQFDERYTLETIKHPPMFMIWGEMSVNGTVTLFFLLRGTTMNGKTYMDLLNDKLELHVANNKCTNFMHDGELSNRSKIVSQILKTKYCGKHAKTFARCNKC